MMRLASVTFIALLAIVSLSACGEPKAVDPRYPVRPEGCEVKIFHESPTMQTDNLGTVTATCGDDISDESCLRTLQNEACKLGADVVWGVPDKPEIDPAQKKHFSGRAAHVKGQTPATKPAPIPAG